VLPLLLSFQPQAGQSAEILLANRLIHSSATLDTLSVVVCDVGPPVRLGLDIA
jgi:hypothetical protein